jgi:hypothetical protein
VDERGAAEADQRLDGPLDELLAGLGEHLDGDVGGTRSCSTSTRTKSKSVALAAGKPTSISL